MLRLIAATFAGLIASALLAEGTLRLLPVSTGYSYRPVNAENPVLRGTPFAPYTYSLGWNFREVNHGTLNNDGYLSHQTYQPADAAGEVALLIGDSYVQAAAVPENLNLHTQLTQKLAPLRVFGLARAGGALPDYLAMARWGTQRYRPRALVFLIVSGDVDDSVNPKVGGAYFRKTPAGFTDVRVDRSEHVFVERALNRSMLFRYMYDNLAFTVNFPSTHPPPNISLHGEPGRLERYEETSTYFLSEIAKVAPREKVIFLIYRSRRAGSFQYEVDVDVLAKKAREQGYRVLDLGPLFADYEARTGLRLDYSPSDTHWNARAHEVVAGELAPMLCGVLGIAHAN